METGSRRVAYLSVLNLYQDNLQSVATKVNQMPFWKPVFCCFFFKSPVITLFCTGNHCASPRLNFSFCIWHSHLYCLSWLLLLSTQFFFSFFFSFKQTTVCCKTWNSLQIQPLPLLYEHLPWNDTLDWMFGPANVLLKQQWFVKSMSPSVLTACREQ